MKEQSRIAAVIACRVSLTLVLNRLVEVFLENLLCHGSHGLAEKHIKALTGDIAQVRQCLFR